MLNYFQVLGVVLTAIFSGVRNPRNGRIVSRKSLQRLGVIVFGSGDNKAALIEEVCIQGYDILVSADGSYAELYAPIPLLAKK